MFSSTGRVVGRSSKSNSPGNARDVKGCCSLVEGTNRPTGLHMYCGGRVPHGMHLATPTYCVRAQDTLPYAGVVSSSASLAAGQTTGSKAAPNISLVSLELRRDNPRRIHKRLRRYVRAGPRAGGDHSTATTQGVVQVRRPCIGSSAFYIGMYCI
jgi:hypothetical protein